MGMYSVAGELVLYFGVYFVITGVYLFKHFADSIVRAPDRLCPDRAYNEAAIKTVC